jgi:hypothetical protein
MVKARAMMPRPRACGRIPIDFDFSRKAPTN